MSRGALRILRARAHGEDLNLYHQHQLEQWQDQSEEQHQGASHYTSSTPQPVDERHDAQSEGGVELRGLCKHRPTNPHGGVGQVVSEKGAEQPGSQQCVAGDPEGQLPKRDAMHFQSQICNKTQQGESNNTSDDEGKLAIDRTRRGPRGIQCLVFCEGAWNVHSRRRFCNRICKRILFDTHGVDGELHRLPHKANHLLDWIRPASQDAHDGF
mmetsp:Transcript_38537/g.110664  ORF Transcript_38537/g.110664 Transcript_38537/m.110664 type:complete len:212 (+) Transcript_38537:1256-1891(+)